MADKLMLISNDDTQNYTFCWLQLVVKKFGHSTYSETSYLNGMKVSKVVKQTNKKTLLENFRD